MPHYVFRMPRHDTPQYQAPANGKEERTEAYDRAKRIRSSARWQKVRALKIARHPLCEWCNDRPADQVHHIEPVARRPELAFKLENLMSLCTRCHEGIEKAARRGATIRELLRMRDG